MDANDVAFAAPTTTTLGRYTIIKHLAQGGMADVLLARTRGIEGFERHVVLKRIRAEQARDERYVSMFLDEARLAASLHHHNIVQVNDIGQEDGEYFFAMEYVHGEDVRSLLMKLSERDEQVPLEHVITIVTAAAAGLHHAHEQRGPDRTPLGVVHRDVSPANILLGYDGGVKVADFGIAKAAHRTTETRSGTLKGKVAYMSPEQCVGEAVDRRSDVFSLGIVLYELATVRRLFKCDNDFLTMTSIVLGHIPPPSKFRPDLPPELEDVILKALGNKPEDRFASADEMRLALEQLAAKLGLRTSSTTLADYVKQQFGERAEPWLVEEEPECEVSIDFDGSASGVVQPPLNALLDFGIPDRSQQPPAPIARARSRAITAGQLPGAARASAELPPGPEPQAASRNALRLVAPVELHPAPVTPRVGSLLAAAPVGGRRRLSLAATVAAVLVIAASLVIVGARGERSSSTVVTPAKSAEVDGTTRSATSDAPTAVVAPPAGSVAPPPVVEPRSPPSIAVTPAPAVVKKPARVAPTKRSTKSGPKKRWDPNALFPE